jgi:uncharacterized protein YkwD
VSEVISEIKMPVKSKTKPVRSNSVTHRKRRGDHHKQSKHYVKVYWPYVPMLLIVMIGLFFGSPNRTINGNVMAYATEMSSSGLLSASNSHRSANGKSALSLNSKLTSAAQTKANDMAARNYWSHTTPDGKEPWYFVEQAGYSYAKAGENLAYGFSTSSQTVNGWMNSPTHRDNMLDSAFTEVGFGYVNSASYNNSGQQTIVVAMYGQPQVAGVSQAAPAAPTPAPTPSAPAPAPAPAPTPTTQETAPTAPAAPTEQKEDTVVPAKEEEQPVTTASTAKSEPSTQSVSRIESFASSNMAPLAALAVGLASIGSLAFVLVKHGFAFKRAFIHGEQFFIHHPMLDITLTSVVMLGYTLSQTSGFIK